MLKRILCLATALCMLAVCAFAEPAYQPGTYSAVGAGFGGDVTVTMTFDESSITDVQITGEQETDGVGSIAVEKLPAAIMEAQSADVEGVTGASFTSKAIQLAAQDCINEASGVAEEVSVRMKPGEYVGQGIGFRISEPVTVTVTVSEDAIEDIVVDQENISDTKGMVETVVDALVPRMLEYQSVSVDAVCGATATSNGVKQAAEAALVQAITAAGGDAKDVRAFYRSLPQVNETVELTTDVLVVGLGGSGMASALSAAEQGLEVLAIDKAAKFGGNAVLTSGPMAINVPSQVEAEIPEWTDPVTKEVITKKAGDNLIDKEALYQAWLEYTTNDEGEQQAKPEMVRLFLDESGYTDDWLTQYGFQFDPASGFAGNSWAAYTPISGGKKLTEGFFAECMENYVMLGGLYLLETEAYDLIVEDGAVVGAKARSMVDGMEYVIHAKAVVLATGGYAGSGAMEEKYLENTYYPLKGEWKLFGMHQNDGKMLEAAIQNGAGTYNISVAPMVHVGGVDGFLPGFETVPVEGEIGYATGRPAVWSQGDLPLNMAISSDTLAVGKDAKRFTAETALSMFNPWISGPHFYSIYGNDQVEKLKTEGFDEVPYGPSTNYLGYGTSIPAGVPMDQADTVLQAAIDAGYVFRADTLEDLAAQMGLDPEALTATVEAYNAACEAGEDAEFGKDPKYLKPITGAPYYGIIGSSWCYSTCGGLNVNEKFQVLRAADEQPIQGLYAVGTDSMGVLFSETKAYVTYGGGAMGYAFTSGRLVGANIAEAIGSGDGAYIPGTYTGTGAGRNGDVVVDVEFSDDAIVSVTVREHQETEGIGDVAVERLPEAIVEAQSLGVDAVTGATLTSAAILEAVADAAAQAGADVEALKAVKVEKTGAAEKIEKSADVLVIGAGGAGMAAAASAAQNGASVIVLEKTAAVGGNTLASGLAMNAADPELAAQVDTLNGQLTTLEAVLDYDEADFGDFGGTLATLKEQIKEYLAGDTSKEFDSVEWHIIQTYLGGKRTDINGNPVEGRYDLLSTLCGNSLDTFHWLGDEVGIELVDTMSSPVGSLWLRGHNFQTKPGVFSASCAYIEGHGGEIMTDTRATHLIVEDGAVVGAQAVRPDGTEVEIRAKAVVLTTGGFGANSEMVKEYNTYWPSIPDGIMTTCVAAATGDGIALALEAGAQLRDMGLTQLMPTASAVTGQLADGLLVPSQYYMFVNQEGERFVNEYAERDTLAFAALSQTGGIFYHIADQEMIPTLQNKATQEDVDAMAEKGILYKADSLEELAGMIGCPAENLIASVERYNGFVDAGKDDDFGKNVFGTKIETAPFYAVIEKPSVHHTMGGVAINTKAEALNESDEPIPGLYAAGEVTGGVHAGNRLGGNAIADCFVFGKIAGASAAEYAK